MRSAAAGPAPVPTGTDEQLSRQYPKYYVVKGHLAHILAQLAPGEPLPAERALAERFSTSRTTIRQALRELAIEGRLVRIRGRGTFAAPPKMAQRLQLTSYTEDMRRLGLVPRSLLLSVSQVRADEEMASRLDVRSARVYASSACGWRTRSPRPSRPPTWMPLGSRAWPSGWATPSRFTPYWLASMACT